MVNQRLQYRRIDKSQGLLNSDNLVPMMYHPATAVGRLFILDESAQLKTWAYLGSLRSL